MTEGRGLTFESWVPAGAGDGNLTSRAANSAREVKFRRQSPELAVMATTKGNSACPPGYLLAVAFAKGANATLQKPFSAAELLAAVAEALSVGV